MENQKLKYQQIVDWIHEEVQTGRLRPGAKLESEMEMAERFSMSRQTIRRALQDLAEQGLIEKRRGSGTYLQSDKKDDFRRKTYNLAVLMTYENDYIFPTLLRQIEGVVSPKGYTVQICFSHNRVERETEVLEGLLEKDRIDGIVVEPVKSGLPNPNKALYEAFQKKEIPMLFINSYYEDMNIPHISLDDEQAGYLVTEYLISQGHREVGAIFKNDDGQGLRRYKGYMTALRNHGISLDGCKVIWCDTDDEEHMQEESERYLRRLKGCTACVCYNDVVAIQLEKICAKRQIDIPRQLSVVGIDNSELAGVCQVPLTTAINPLEELGTRTGELILWLIEGKKVKTSTELKPKMKVRQSVQKIEMGSQ